MHTAPFRLLRTFMLAVTVLGLAAGAHLAAGGILPAPPIMVAILALHTLCATAVTHFKLQLPAMAVLLGAGQVVLHQGFELLSHGAHAVSESPAAEAMAHHSMTAEAHAASLLAKASSLPVDALGHSSTSGWMLTAHVVATLAAAALLAYGEVALWALADWLRPLYRRAAVVRILPARAAAAVIADRPLPRLPWSNIRPDTRRGPPLRTAISV